jgi:hypothetical protein
MKTFFPLLQREDKTFFQPRIRSECEKKKTFKLHQNEMRKTIQLNDPLESLNVDI